MATGGRVSVANGQPVKRYAPRNCCARSPKRRISAAIPGMQFDTTINRWHTSKSDRAHQRIESVLGIHVPGRFGLQPGVAEPDEVRRTGRRVRCRSLPPRLRHRDHGAGDHRRQRQLSDRKIARNSHDFRPLGLGFANLGALLMSMGIPYDSPQGRDWAGAITAVMCGQAYLTSARIAEGVGPCPGYAENEESFLDVILMHGKAVSAIDSKRVPADLYQAAEECWKRCLCSWASGRLPQRADHGDRAHRHHRLHDGLRHHRHRARSGAGEVQEAGRRRRHQDRQQYRAAGADQARLHARAGGADRHAHRFHRHHRRRAGL